MSKKTKRTRSKAKAAALASSRGQAGVERAEALAAGGQQALVWRSGGMKAGFTADLRKRASKRACRGMVRSES